MKENSVTTEFKRLEPDIQRSVDEQVDVLGDALVRIVGGVALQLHAVVIGAVQPFAEIVPGQPAPPANLQPLIEVELVDGKHDGDRRQHTKDADLPDEDVPIVFLQRVEEAILPLVHENVDRDRASWSAMTAASSARPAHLSSERK